MPFDHQLNGTYAAVTALLAELADVFPDRYLHLGGDEVPFDCWRVRDVTHVIARPSAWTMTNLPCALVHCPPSWQVSWLHSAMRRCHCQLMRDHTEAARFKPTAADSGGMLV